MRVMNLEGELGRNGKTQGYRMTHRMPLAEAGRKKTKRCGMP